MFEIKYFTGYTHITFAKGDDTLARLSFKISGCFYRATHMCIHNQRLVRSDRADPYLLLEGIMKRWELPNH